MNDLKEKVLLWEDDVEIPTYLTGKPDKNPMFLEKRVYQGSSGRVYPIPVIEKITDEKVMKKYRVVFLENKYLQIWLIPELGGRVYRALDKTNNFDFVYYNRVIKPALVGLAGPWISGGIEFNWPQHHRPSTFSPAEYTFKDNDDGSKTVFIGEIDRMYGTKYTAGFTLYPDKAYLEIKVLVYNRTSEPQTFLWWANPAFSVNEHTQSIFPPDVHAVFDHGKRDVSKFPIATGTYYKVDYSSGVDISRHVNIPVPTSYMAYYSDYDFLAAYDFSKEAGLLHVADHHVSPGKKQWTWGSGDFGQAWDRNLTDEDGPYVELMTGVFTDNQPDFTWIQPYEEKTFAQYFMPYKGIGAVKNATTDAAVNLELADGKAKIAVYATSVFEDAEIVLTDKKGAIHRVSTEISPVRVYKEEIFVPSPTKESDLTLTVRDKNGRVLVSYTPKEREIERIPDPAKALPDPAEVKNNEALYLAGLHLEQYRHATYEPEKYYEEGLKRDPDDIRINNAYGLLLLKRGQIEKSEQYFRRAIKSATRHNPNPYDGEPYYNLGLSLKLQERYEEAYAAFHKACWCAAMQDRGFFSLARIAAIKGEFRLALEHVEKSLVKNYHNYSARNLKAALFRKLKQYDKAEKTALETIELDMLDFGAYNELYLIYKELGRNEETKKILSKQKILMRGSAKNYLALSVDYAEAGMYAEATEILQRAVEEKSRKGRSISPMLYYYIGWYMEKLNNPELAMQYYEKGALACPDYCFPNKLHDLLVLKGVIKANPWDSKAYYYLGNLWYDKKQYAEAIECWEKSRELDDTFPAVHRNLSLAYYNKLNAPEKARESLEKAFELDKKDARVFFELDQLYKKIGVSPSERLKNLERHLNLVGERDDLYVEYITLINMRGDYERAKALMMNRKFHPWEGGEGKITKQYVFANIGMGKKLLAEGKYRAALEVLKEAETYPHNLGEGKLIGTKENHLNYYIGCAYEALGDYEKAREYYRKATEGQNEPANAMFYNDQPPEMIFYQGLAFARLGETDKAKGRFNKLISYGEKHIFDDVKIDYFAVSLPDFLVFDQDLNKQNVAHCHFLIGLGYLGLGNHAKAREEFEKVLALDPNHMGAVMHMQMLSEEFGGKGTGSLP